MTIARIKTDETSEQVPEALRAINTVLLVDDSRAQLTLLSAMMRQWGYGFRTAGSGAEALEICRKETIDLVISDWMMPEMDGLAFCKAFRALPTEHYGYFILVTSKNEKQDIATGLDVGADEFLTKPVNPDELRARINAAERILVMQRRLNAQMAQLRKLYEKLDQDLIEARKLQQSLVRERHVRRGPVALSFLLEPSGHVGGDLVGWFNAGPRHIGFFSLDVSGHGVPSALLTTRLAGMLTTDNPDHNIALMRDAEGNPCPRPPDAAAVLLNEAMLESMDTDLYFTMVLGHFEPATGQVTMVQAGQSQPGCATGKWAGGVHWRRRAAHRPDSGRKLHVFQPHPCAGRPASRVFRRDHRGHSQDRRPLRGRRAVPALGAERPSRRGSLFHLFDESPRALL